MNAMCLTPFVSMFLGVDGVRRLAAVCQRALSVSMQSGSTQRWEQVRKDEREKYLLKVAG